jgi:hypothetical protein
MEAILVYILWHVDLLLGNDNEIGNYTTAVTRQRPVNSNRAAFSCVVRAEMLLAEQVRCCS